VTRANRGHRHCGLRLAVLGEYELNEPASVSVTLQQLVAGRRVGRRCVAPTRRDRGHARCVRRVPLPGTLVFQGRAGSNAFAVYRRSFVHRLTPGTYRLIITPIAGSRAGAAKTARFVVLP